MNIKNPNRRQDGIQKKQEKIAQMIKQRIDCAEMTIGPAENIQRQQKHGDY